MPSFLGGLGDAAKAALCPLMEKGQQLYQVSPGSQLDFFGNYKQFLNFATRALCNRPPDGEDLPGPETCFAKRYRINYTVNYKTLFPEPGSDQSTTSEIVVFGPIYGYKWTISGDQSNGPANLVVVHSDGISQTTRVTSQLFATSSPDDTNFRYTINSVTDLDPDDSCITPPIPPDPGFNPGDWIVEGDYTFEYNDGIDLTVPVFFIFAPIKIDVNGTISIPVKVDFRPAINIDPTFDFDVNIDIPINGDPPIIQPKFPPPSLPPSDPGSPNLPKPDDFEPFPPAPSKPPEIPDGENPDPPDEAATVIRGALVTTTSIADGSEVGIVGQGDNPDINIPNLGFISFKVRFDGGNIGWTTDIPVKNTRHIIECPWLGGAIDVRGTPRLGVNFTVTPIWGKQVAEV